MNFADEQNLKHVIRQALQREHGDSYLVERTIVEAFIDACAHGYFGDRMHGIGREHIAVAAGRNRGRFLIQLSIPTLSAKVITAKCKPMHSLQWERMSEFTGIDYARMTATRELDWEIELEVSAQEYSQRVYDYRRQEVAPTRENKEYARKAAEALSNLEKQESIKAAMDCLVRICLTVGSALWQSVDDTTKRYMMLDMQPSKFCPPAPLVPLELEL